MTSDAVSNGTKTREGRDTVMAGEGAETIDGLQVEIGHDGSQMVSHVLADCAKAFS